MLHILLRASNWRAKTANNTHAHTYRKEPKEILEGWNLEFEREAVHVTGRVLPPETIYHSAKVRVSSPFLQLSSHGLHFTCLLHIMCNLYACIQWVEPL